MTVEIRVSDEQLQEAIEAGVLSPPVAPLSTTLIEDKKSHRTFQQFLGEKNLSQGKFTLREKLQYHLVELIHVRGWRKKFSTLFDHIYKLDENEKQLVRKEAEFYRAFTKAERAFNRFMRRSNPATQSAAASAFETLLSLSPSDALGINEMINQKTGQSVATKLVEGKAEELLTQGGKITDENIRQAFSPDTFVRYVDVSFQKGYRPELQGDEHLKLKSNRGKTVDPTFVRILQDPDLASFYMAFVRTYLKHLDASQHASVMNSLEGKVTEKDIVASIEQDNARLVKLIQNPPKTILEAELPTGITLKEYHRLVELYRDSVVAQMEVKRSKNVIQGIKEELIPIESEMKRIQFTTKDLLKYPEEFPSLSGMIQQLQAIADKVERANAAHVRAQDALEQVSLYRKFYANEKMDAENLVEQIQSQNDKVKEWATRYEAQLELAKDYQREIQEIQSKMDEASKSELEKQLLDPKILRNIKNPALALRARFLLDYLDTKKYYQSFIDENERELATREKSHSSILDKFKDVDIRMENGVIVEMQHPEICNFLTNGLRDRLIAQRKTSQLFISHAYQLSKSMDAIIDEKAAANYLTLTR